MSKTWVEGVCNESTGFLFKHQCPQFADGRCSLCDKPICAEHTFPVDDMTLCPACDQAEARRRGAASDPNRRSDHDSYYDSGTYYSGYGHYGPRHMGFFPMHGRRERSSDPNDFHAGDAESLKNEGDEEFETDMGES